ncbi:MAG: hypothetical protein IPM97_11715 [Bdellovibrionaceae bacterium]|nr:hypothetical protein [Pseudobdellovibrionaceae bacterium]
MNKLITAVTLMLLFLGPIGCGKVYNSSTYDASTYGSADGSAQFLAAKTIIKNSCANCHTRPSHEAWSGMSEKDFISKGLVAAGNLAGSSLYTKIQGNRTSTPGNMPDGGSLLTGSELDTLESWILNITP